MVKKIKDAELFVSCTSEGYLDVSAYPFVDGHLVFCGIASREKSKWMMTLDGLVALTFAQRCSNIKEVSCLRYIPELKCCLVQFFYSKSGAVKGCFLEDPLIVRIFVLLVLKIFYPPDIVFT